MNFLVRVYHDVAVQITEKHVEKRETETERKKRIRACTDTKTTSKIGEEKRK